MARKTLYGIAGPTGGPWWWETLAGNPEDRRVFGGDQANGIQEELQVIEHTWHGHQLLSVVGSDSVAWSKDFWKKCLVFCWGDKEQTE